MPEALSYYSSCPLTTQYFVAFVNRSGGLYFSRRGDCAAQATRPRFWRQRGVGKHSSNWSQPTLAEGAGQKQQSNIHQIFCHLISQSSTLSPFIHHSPKILAVSENGDTSQGTQHKAQISGEYQPNLLPFLLQPSANHHSSYDTPPLGINMGSWKERSIL